MLYQLVSLRQVFLRFNKLTRIEEEIGNLNVCFNFILEISYLALLDSFSSMSYLNVIESKLFSQRCHDVEKYLKCERVKLLEAPVLLTLSRRRSLSYRNQSINLLSILAGFYMIRTSITKELNGEMEFFLYDISVWILLNDFQGRIENTFKHLRWSVIRQKGKSQKERFKKTKHDKFSEKQTVLTPLTRTRTCAYQGVRNVRSSENVSCFAFLKHPFWDSPFCLITDEMELLFFSILDIWQGCEYASRNERLGEKEKAWRLMQIFRNFSLLRVNQDRSEARTFRNKNFK